MDILDPVPHTFWHEVAAGCPWATYFHTPQWAAAIAAAFPHCRVATAGFVLESGVRAVLPCVSRHKKRLLGTRTELKSMEPGVYGGFIADGDLGSKDLELLAVHLLGAGSGRIVESPLRPLPLPAGFTAKQLTTHIVDLEGGFDAVRSRFSRGQKSNLNQARKKNVLIRKAETPGDIRSYYDMYLQSMKRWGSDAEGGLPHRLFEELFEQRGQGASFWLAETGDTIIAGALVLGWNRTLVYWHGCALQDYFKHYPNNLLHAAIIRWACDNGFTAYDMGASMGLAGVARFKQSFGARSRPFTSWRWK